MVPTKLKCSDERSELRMATTRESFFGTGLGVVHQYKK